LSFDCLFSNSVIACSLKAIIEAIMELDGF